MLRLWFFRFGFRPAIKTGNAGFDFFQQLVVSGNLPIYLPLVGTDAALFHLAGSWPQMDRGNFINALPLVAAVVNTLRSTGRFQCPVGVGCPRCPPNLHISFIVPVGRILPMIFPAAFPIRDTLSILVQIVCLAALCAPLSIFFQRPERQHDMDMRVSGSLVMDSKVSTHSFVYKVVLHIGTHKGDTQPLWSSHIAYRSPQGSVRQAHRAGTSCARLRYRCPEQPSAHVAFPRGKGIPPAFRRRPLHPRW